MAPRDRLRANLLAEGRAYGYTLTVWGAGAMLIHAYGVPSPAGVFAFVGGALAAMTALALVAFDGLFDTQTARDAYERQAASIVHVAAALGNLAASYAVIWAATPALPAHWAFSLVGFQATVGYNVLLLFEDGVARVVG
ncbi:hypothetical protein [Halobacterium sp. CBA1126]|uniref:hypothetical protein n=1 Tax=Halobacterium sp. CBA1126 TaxID=2668074 RepID=UPI0018D20434|nr:hypothetical protein [Halobacterium sp. CBA1126]